MPLDARRSAPAAWTSPRRRTPTSRRPGYYMLFLLNDHGVPSVAKLVKLSAGGAAPARVSRPAAVPPVDPPVVEPPPGKPDAAGGQAAGHASGDSAERGPGDQPAEDHRNQDQLPTERARAVKLSFERKPRGPARQRALVVEAEDDADAQGQERSEHDRLQRAQAWLCGRSYRLTVRATDSAGKRSSPRSVRFRVRARHASRAGSSAFARAIGGLAVFTRRS